MIFSKYVANYQTLYNLTPEQVFFSMLLSCGATPLEAYQIIFRSRITNRNKLDEQIKKMIAETPGINELKNYLAKRAGATISGEETPDVEQYRDKESVIKGLEETIPTLRGKERADVLMKIADLQQMKKEENTIEEKRVHYYLPLSCNRCNLFLEAREKERRRKAREAAKELEEEESNNQEDTDNI